MHLSSYVKKHKTSLGLLSILLLGVFATFAIETITSYYDQEKQIREYHETLATTFEGYAVELISQIDGISKQLKRLLEKRKSLKSTDVVELSQICQDFAFGHPEIEVVGVVNSEGTYIGNSQLVHEPKEVLKISIADRPHFKKMRDDPKDELVVSLPLNSRTTQKPVLVFSRRLNDQSGNFAGNVFISVKLQVWSEFLSHVVLQTGEAVSVWREGVYLLARYPYVKDDQLGKQFPASKELQSVFQRQLSTAHYATHSTLDGKYRFFSYRKFESLPFYILVAHDYDVAFQYWKKNFFVSSALTLVLVLVSVFAVITLINYSEKIEHQQSFLAAASKMSALGEMAAGIAHEINNPLAIISGNASILIRLSQESVIDTPQIQERSKTIHKTVERISKVVKSLLSLSRNSENDRKVPVEFKKIMNDLIEISSDKMNRYGITLKTQFPSLLKINCRESQIGQVLLNLIYNSMDAISSLPNTISEKWVEVSAQQLPDQRIQIRVTDCGPGIPKEIQDKIGQPFFTTKAAGKGTGLGLSISRGIVESHGGTFRYDSTSKNTSFVIELPSIENETSVKKT